jgi:hypothetical protein
MLVWGSQNPIPMYEPLQSHIKAIHTRRFAAKLLRATGADDRTQPAARQWLRRWAPTQDGAVIPTCSCHVGVCSICN